MGAQQLQLTAGWIQDGTTLLYHYYQEEPGMAAHPSLCAKELLVTATVRRLSGELPQGLTKRYANFNRMDRAKVPGICTACANRWSRISKREINRRK